MLHRHAGEIRDLLAQARQPVKQRRFSGVGRTDDGHDVPPAFARPAAEVIVAAGQPWQSPIVVLQSLTENQIAPQSHGAARLPTRPRETRADRRPGAECAGTTACPGRKPISINRRASSSGRSSRSRIPDSPRLSSVRFRALDHAFLPRLRSRFETHLHIDTLVSRNKPSKSRVDAPYVRQPSCIWNSKPETSKLHSQHTPTTTVMVSFTPKAREMARNGPWEAARWSKPAIMFLIYATTPACSGLQLPGGCPAPRRHCRGLFFLRKRK